MEHQPEADRPTNGNSLSVVRMVATGGVLAVVIGAAFGFIDSIQEKLVTDTTREKGRDFVDAAMIKVHWEAWEQDPTRRDFMKRMIRDLPNQQYEFKILAIPDAEGNIQPLRPGGGEIRQLVLPPDDGWERTRLESLRDEWKEQLAEMRRARTEPEKDGANPATSLVALLYDIPPKFAERHVQGKDQEEYHYYQPAYFKPSCNNCHIALKALDAFAPAEDPALLPQGPPFRVVKVVIDYTSTRQAINWTRAILISIAILTFVVSMVAIYAITRWTAPAANDARQI